MGFIAEPPAVYLLWSVVLCSATMTELTLQSFSRRYPARCVNIGMDGAECYSSQIDISFELLVIHEIDLF